MKIPLSEFESSSELFRDFLRVSRQSRVNLSKGRCGSCKRGSRSSDGLAKSHGWDVVHRDAGRSGGCNTELNDGAS